MKLSNSRKKLFQFFVLLLAISTSVYIHLNLRHYASDDAYIHFRVADNLSNNKAPFYNLGEQVKVSTSTGWIILLAGFTYLSNILSSSLDLLAITAVLNGMMLVFGALIYLHIFKFLTEKEVSPLYSLVFIILYFSICFTSSLGMMETVTSLTILGIGILFLLKGKTYSYIFFGIAIFFRPELSLPAGLFLVYSFYRCRSCIPLICLSFIAGILPFLLFDLYFYGTIVPQAVIAKSIIYNLSLGDAIAIIFSRIRGQFFLFPLYDQFSFLYLFYSVYTPILFLSIFLVRSRKKISHFTKFKYKIIWLFFLWGNLLIFSYLIRRVLVFPWYDPLYLVPLLIVLGYVFLTTVNKRELIFQHILLTPMVILSVLLLFQNVFAVLSNPAYFTDFPEGARARQYISVGRELYSQYPKAKLLTSEIGGLGYGFNGYIIDAAGLATPDAVKYHNKTDATRGFGMVPDEYIKVTQPDIIVSYDIFLEEDFMDSELFVDFEVNSYPLFLEDDRKRSVINRPFGEPYKRILWGIDRLYVFTRKNLDR